MTKTTIWAASAAAAVLLAGCEKAKQTSGGTGGGDGTVKLITLDPGHFHAALVQKRMYPDVSPTVHVYAPEGNDLKMHMDRINSFNTRADQPTKWESKIYTGPDFLEKMLKDKAGNVVVLAGNNARKTEYILKSVQAGYNVLADKPMAITPKDFELLKQAFETAKQKGVLLYDIMTERHEITTLLQRELSRFPKVYGTQEKGTPDDPAVTKESVHHFCKLVAGKPLQRPPWYYDTAQQGEAIVDVNTHLTDLVQWETFPGVTLSPADVNVVNARVWPTPITLEQFKTSTSQGEWPDYLKKSLDANNVLQCRANGEFTYALKGVYAKVSVLWNFQPPAGAGDTHFSLMRGTRSSLIIQQGEAEGYKPALYVEPRRGTGVKPEEIGDALKEAVAEINKTYPGIGFEKHETGWRINIPASYAIRHEAHFGQVTEAYLGFLKNHNLPAWEVPNMLTKYHTLMEAYKKSR
ncbi:MAG: putative oxidoreductase C-terminal domain-containing protein [Kiritimatiellae bacterium]|nr:putative oxidoreductase C-terminal domain-containing protein [Kiritimatiellia bacterium]